MYGEAAAGLAVASAVWAAAWGVLRPVLRAISLGCERIRDQRQRASCTWLLQPLTLGGCSLSNLGLQPLIGAWLQPLTGAWLQPLVHLPLRPAACGR